MSDINLHNITEDNLTYLEQICNNDFYQNDREFIKIIAKLTKQSSKLGNKALNLVNILNEAEVIKFNMTQKELSLGLKEYDKPYGETSLNNIANTTLVNIQNTPKKIHILHFLELLEKYLDLDELKNKKDVLIEAKAYIKILKDLGVNPINLIITQDRAKLWHILENDFINSIKKLDIDLFLEKIRLTRIQYQSEINEISNYYKNKTDILSKLNNLKQEVKTEDSIKKIKNYENILQKPISTNIEPLLKDTSKILKSLDYMLEEIPQELTTIQQNELKQFLPAISEYYIDQTYAIRNGNSYTKLDDKLQKLQKDIDNNKSIDVILKNVNELGNTMQHLYILHWIGESILKEILKCFSFKCSMGRTINFYNKNFNTTETSLNLISKAVKIRNEIAHQGLLWNPDKIKFAITEYHSYLSIIIKEQKIDTSKTYLPKENRELTEEQIENRSQDYVEKEFNINFQEFKKANSDIYNRFIIDFKKSNYKLSYRKKNTYKDELMNEYSKQTFNLTFTELKDILIKDAKNNWKNFDDKNEHKAYSIFISLFYHKNELDEAESMIKKINQRINNKKRGILSKLFK